MHLLISYKHGALRVLPQMLPPGLYEAASRRGPSRQSTGPTSGGIPPVPNIPSAYSGQGQRTSSPMGREQYPSPSSAQQGDVYWAIHAQDKANFDAMYASIDKNNRGYITGEEAVPFFSNSA